jgi:exodeoxyribonuclease VII large subunit
MKKGPPTAAPDQGDLFGPGPTRPSPLTAPTRQSTEAIPRPAPTAPPMAVPARESKHVVQPAVAPLAAPLPPPAVAEPRERLAPTIAAPLPHGGHVVAVAPAAAPARFQARLPSTAVGASSGAAPTAAVQRPARQVLSVGELTRRIKTTLERGFPLVTVRGEVSGFRGPNVRGHLYFNLKDAEACVEAKIWASLANRLKFKLRDGLEVIVEGSVDVFEPQGRYSLIIQRIEPAGEGALALAFQQLKERLMSEGLFGDRRVRPPRPIPFLPRRVGVVTSVSGAALRDFLRVLHQRHPRLPVLVCDARVQGDGSADEVVRAIERLSRTDVDVIVVTRGGGSIEDLWTFNEEKVARAIFRSPVPVVSAVGHEVDFTIADFVADLRAPTPSAAAEKLAPVLADLELSLVTSERRLRKAMERHLLAARQAVERLRARVGDPRRILGQKRLHLSTHAERLARSTRLAIRAQRDRQRALGERLARQRPQTQLRQNREVLVRLSERVRSAMRESLRRYGQAVQRARSDVLRLSPIAVVRQKHGEIHAQRARLVELERKLLASRHRRLHGFAEKLDAMSPLAVMARGYSVTFRAEDWKVVRGADDVRPGDAISIRLARGKRAALAECDDIEATVTATRPGAETPPGADGETD